MEYNTQREEKDQAYALGFTEGSNNRDSTLQAVGYDSERQVSIFSVNGVEVTAEALLDDTPNGTLRDIIKEEAVTGGGT